MVRGCVVVLLVVVILTVACLSTARNETLCRVSVPDLASKCLQYARGSGPETEPSPECCGVIKNADIGCACGRVNWIVQRFVNMKKAVHVARSCGLKVPPPGTKCGSYKIPGN